MKRILVEQYEIAGIPILTMHREALTHAPMVFWVHGYTGHKSDDLALGYALAAEGILYVALDARLHGDRFEPRQTQPEFIYPPDTGIDVWLMLLTEVVPKTSEDISALIDHFSTDPRVDASRIGISGASMGGWTTFYTAANEPRIAAAAPMISYPGFSAMWDQVLAESGSYPKWADRIRAISDQSARYTETLRAIDPFPKLMSYAPKPLLMVIGDRDTDAPKHTTVALYRSLVPLYAEHPDRLRLSIYDGIDHRVTREMREEVAAWFAALWQ